MTIWDLAAIPGDLLLLSCAAWAFVCPGAWLLRQPAKRRAGGQPAPGDGQAPVPGEAASTARPPLSPLRPPPPAPGFTSDHGGDVKIIAVKGDGRAEITDCRTGHTEIIPGDCPACRDGQCSWCAAYPVWDSARGRWVRRYQRCPAHQDKERQP